MRNGGLLRVGEKIAAALFVGVLAGPAFGAEPDAVRATRDPLHLTFDWTLGFGKVDVVDARVNASASRTQSQIGLNTFIVGGAYDVTKDFTVGLRLPFTFGILSGISSEAGRTTALGNVELRCDVRKKFSETTIGAGTLGIALPSSLGTELPTQAELDAIPPGQYNPTEANRFAINQAAAAAAGYETNPLFWSRRLAFTPGAEARFSSGRIRLTPYLRMSNLIDTHDTSAERYRMEIVFGAGAGWRALEWLDFGLRVWGAVAPVRRDGSPVGAGVASPEVRVLFGTTREHAFYVAGVLPFVGSNVDPHYFGAVRAGLAGTF